MSKTHRIEITFPVEVELTNDDLRIIGAALDGIASRYEASNPSRVMWSFGQGSKMLVNPLMLSDDEPIPFDDSVYHIEMAEREAHPEEIARREKRASWTLASAIEQIEKCGYECTGGALANNQAWRWILRNFAAGEEMKIDLMAIDFGDRKEMSVALFHKSDRAQDKLLGPVPYKNAVSALAPLLVAAMPGRFTPEAAIAYLTVIHLRNCTTNRNSMGVEYPMRMTGVSDAKG